MYPDTINFAEVSVKLEGNFRIPSIHFQYLNDHLTKIIKEVSELEKEGGSKRELSFSLGVSYQPVRDDERIIQYKRGE